MTRHITRQIIRRSAAGCKTAKRSGLPQTGRHLGYVSNRRGDVHAFAQGTLHPWPRTRAPGWVL